MNNQLHKLHKKVVVTMGCAAIVMSVLPTAALADDTGGVNTDFAARIDNLQQEINALQVEGKSIPSAPSVGSVVITPPGLDFSVYGVGHMSADSINTGTGSNSYIHSNSSRLGFKGDYGLNNNYSVFFQYETGVDLTGNGTEDGNGGGTANGILTRVRDSFVGIKGDFGTATTGRLPALNQWVYDYNLFADQIGDLGNIWGQHQPDRVNSAIQYGTPNFNGLSAAVTYAPGGQNNDNAVPNNTNTIYPNSTSLSILKLNYNKGGFNLGGALAGYDQGPGLSTQKDDAVTASYNFGTFSIGGGFQWETDIGGVSGRNQNESTLGAADEVAPGETIKLQFAQAGNIGSLANSGTTQWAIGYDHAWNKQTTLYVAYAQTKNGSASNFQSYGYGHGTFGVPNVGLGENTSALSFGIIYRFDMSRQAISKL